MSNPFSAKWSAQGHTLCLGHWQIHYHGVEIELPEEMRERDMGTYGNFSYLFPDDPAWEEGMQESEWILANLSWLMELFETYGIPFDAEHCSWFYAAVNASDWRCSACGGCI